MNPPRKLVLIQIDGLAAQRLARALDEGYMPELKHWMDERIVVQGRKSVSPPSTPVFQSSLLYAQPKPVVHGYAWFDRRSGRVCRCDVPEDLAAIEETLSCNSSAKPLLSGKGAASYCVTFLGGCGRALFTLANGMFPSGGWRTPKLLAGLAKVMLRVPGEIARGAADMARFVRERRTTEFEWNWLAMRVLNAAAFEDLATMHAVADMQEAAPVIYINYIAYDECAHRRGPDHPTAFEQLRRIDERIARLITAARAHGYDVMLFSDHGQAAARPFVEETGRSLGATVMAACAEKAIDRKFARLADQLDEARTRAARVRKWPGRLGSLPSARAMVAARRAAMKLERKYGVPAGELAVVTGGSVAHVYVGRRPEGSSLEEIRARFPRLVATLVGNDAVGLVVARRTVGGPVVFYRGEAAPLDDVQALEAFEPFRQAGAAHLARVIRHVIGADTAGDLVLYGAFARVGDVSFEPELGSHGGLHPDELNLFVAHPTNIELPAGQSLDPVELGRIIRAHCT